MRNASPTGSELIAKLSAPQDRKKSPLAPRLLLLVLAARHPEEVADLLRREDLPLAEAAEARREGRERR